MWCSAMLCSCSGMFRDVPAVPGCPIGVQGCFVDVPGCSAFFWRCSRLYRRRSGLFPAVIYVVRTVPGCFVLFLRCSGQFRAVPEVFGVVPGCFVLFPRSEFLYMPIFFQTNGKPNGSKLLKYTRKSKQARLL